MPLIALITILILTTAYNAAAEQTCARCHPLDGSIGEAANLSWPGPMAWWKANRCPALLEIKWQMYLTESSLYDLEKAAGTGRAGTSREYADRLMVLAEQYRKFKRRNPSSAEAFALQASSIRREMNNTVFRPLADSERRNNIAWSLAGLAAVLAAGAALLFARIRMLKRSNLSSFYLSGRRP